ncbi:MAG: hypothetical protein R3A51_18885 [Nannocystaceae bacterium]|nr:hypothetical protein [Myxococcales bacterium]
MTKLAIHPGHTGALPFTIKRSHDVINADSVTTTTEVIHGLLRLAGGALRIQWRLARTTEHVGEEIRSDEQLEAVREVAVPLSGIATAAIQRSFWRFWRGPRLVLTAADLRAFDRLVGEGGLERAHPARLELQLARGDQLAAEEFCAELAMAAAELAELDEPPALPGGAPKSLPAGPS